MQYFQMFANFFLDLPMKLMKFQMRSLWRKLLSQYQKSWMLEKTTRGKEQGKSLHTTTKKVNLIQLNQDW